MTLDEITDEFLTQVKAVFPELEVDHYPGKPEDYKFIHPVGAVLLIFRDRKFQEPQATDGTVQRNSSVLWLSYFARNLRRTGKDPGVYSFLDRGREKLAGKCIDNEPIWPRREFYVTSRSGVWIYGQEWQLENMFIADEENE